MEIRKLKKINIADEIFKQILQLISDGTWSIGSRIPPEKKLSELFGASRISIRAALQQLKILGLVESNYGNGTFIRSSRVMDTFYHSLMPLLIISKDSMRDLLEFREIIEVEDAKLATSRRTNANLKKLEEIIEKMIEDKNDLSKFAKDDIEFHFEIAKATGNEVIVRIYEFIKIIIGQYMEKIIEVQGMSAALEFHPKIYNAIKNKNLNAASLLMKDHIGLTRKIVIDKLGDESLIDSTNYKEFGKE